MGTGAEGLKDCLSQLAVADTDASMIYIGELAK
jgi:hypothetical protein